MTHNKNFLNYLFFTFAITAWPFLNFYASTVNQREATVGNFFLLFWVFWAAGLFVAEIFQRILKVSRPQILGTYAFTIVMIFSYKNLLIFLEYLHFFKGFYIFVTLYLIGVYCVHKISKNQNTQKITKVFIAVVFCFSLSENLLVYFKDSQGVMPNEKQENLSFVFKERPNVYLILLDAYPGKESLKKATDFSNERFINFFKNKGFIVAESPHSNYAYTWPSLSATFQMEYLKKGDINYHDVLSPQKPVIEVFKKNNYQFIILPSYFPQFQARSSANVIIRSPVVPLSLTSQSFLSNSLFSLLAPFFATEDYFGINEVSKVFDLKKKDSYFCFLHFLNLHDNVYNKNCQVEGEKMTEDVAEQIKCFNPLIENTIDLITKKDPKAVIVVQSDHGPWKWKKNPPPNSSSPYDEFQGGFSTFSAVYIPGLDPNEPSGVYLANSPTPVNNFRIIFSHLAKTPVQLLPDRVYGDELSEEDLTPFLKAHPIR